MTGVAASRTSGLAKAAVLALIGLLAIRLYSEIEERKGSIILNGMELHIEVEAALLGVIALLIILSSQIAAATGVAPGIVELLFGAYLAFEGVEATEVLLILSGIGANMLLFMAGTEIDVGFLKRAAGRAVTVAILSLLPVIPVAIILSPGGAPEALVIVFAALSATSVALTYTIFSTYRVLRARAAQVVLASAMMLDVLGMLLINVATAAVNPLTILYGLVILAALGLQPLLPRVSGAPFELELRLVVMAVIVLGVLSEVLGVHSVLTSFILGLVVSETVRNRKLLREKIEGLATGFFTPFFFIVSGMSIEAGLEPSLLLAALTVGALLAFSKAGAVYIFMTRIMGMGRQISAVAASGVAPLLTVTIIGASVGYDLGIIDSGLYSMLIWIVVASSLVSMAIAKIALK